MNNNKMQYNYSNKPKKPLKPRSQPDKRDLLKKRRMTGPQPPSAGKGKKPGWPLGHRIAFILLLIILGVFLWKQMNPDTANQSKVSYTEFINLLTDNKIQKVKIRNSTLYGELTESMNIGEQGSKRSFNNIIVNIGSYDQAFIKEMVDKDIEVTIEPERTWMNMLVTTLPWILIFAVWLFILRQMQGGPKGIFTFGKSKAKLVAEDQHKATFDDVAGVEEALDSTGDPRKSIPGVVPTRDAFVVGKETVVGVLRHYW